MAQLFTTNLKSSQNSPTHLPANDMTATSQDILILLLPYLSSENATSLFQLCLTPEVLGGRDNGVQKRGYKILTKLIESNKISVDAESVIGTLDELMDGLAAAAKKVQTSYYDFHYLLTIQL